MTVTFPHEVFGSDASTNFDNPTGVADDSCDPTFQAGDNTFQWAKELGTCGMNPTRDNDRIKFVKILTFTPSSDSGTTLNFDDGNAGTIFTQSGTASTQVTFTCSFPTNVVAVANEINVAPDLGAQGVATEVDGSWDGSLTLKYYTDASFGTELEDASHNVFIGSTLFVQSEWSVTSLSTSLRYYINSCKIKDVSTSRQLQIVKDSCYAGTISAVPLGTAAGTALNDKVVTTTSQFQYTSFSFDTSQASNTQELTCTMEFCIFDESDGSNDCTLNHRDGSASCPADAGYNYAA